MQDNKRNPFRHSSPDSADFNLWNGGGHIFLAGHNDWEPRESKPSRGRKPKMSEAELEKLLQEKQTEYQRLQKENAFLQAKLHMLERVVPIKEEVVRFLVGKSCS